MFTTQGICLPYPEELVISQVHHNIVLSTDEDTIIPNVSLEFAASGDLLAPIYPIICQIAFSQTFEDAQNELRALANAYPSMCMAILIDIREAPPYKSPTFTSETRKALSGDRLDYVSFISSSSYYHRGYPVTRLSNIFSPEPLMAGGHAWCSIKEVTYHVWLKADDSDQDVDADSGDHYAISVSTLLTSLPFILTCSKTSPGNAGWDNVEALLLQDLDKVKAAVISYCEIIIRDMVESPPDLTALRLHETTLPISLQSFDEDILRGIKRTSHRRYSEWFSKMFRGCKAPHVGNAGDGSKQS